MWIKKFSFADKHIYLLLSVCLVLILLPQSALSNEVLIRYELGFNGVFRLNSLTPISVFLENKGPETSGDLFIRVGSGSELDENLSETVYTKSVSLPMLSSKRFSFTVFINSYSHPLVIEFKQQGRSSYRSSINLRQHFTENPLVIVVNAPTVRPFFEQPKVDFVSILSLHLPERWDSYHSVEMLVVGADVLGSLTDTQLRALINWVKQGGTLVLTGSLNYAALRDESVQNLVKTQIVGIESDTNLGSLNAFSGDDFFSSRPFIFLNTRPESAKILAKENDIPIIYEKYLGFGKVVFLAFDYQQSSFLNWEGWLRFWEKIYQLKPNQSSFVVNFNKSSLLTALLRENSAGFPSLRKTTILLFAYLLCLIVVFRYMNRDDAKSKTRLVLLITISSIFTASGLWIFSDYLGAKAPTWTEIRQLKLSKDDSTALVRQFTSAMAFQKSEFRLDIGAKTQMVQLLDKGSDDGKHVFLLNQIRKDESAVFPMKNWSYSYLRTDHLSELPIDGDISYDRGNLTIILNNNSPHSFYGCYLFFENSLLALGEIDAQEDKNLLFTKAVIDQNRMVEGNQKDRVPSEKIAFDRPFFFRDLNRSLKEDLLDSVREKFEAKKDSVILIGQLLPENGWERSPTTESQGNKSFWIVEWELPINYQ